MLALSPPVGSEGPTTSRPPRQEAAVGVGRGGGLLVGVGERGVPAPGAAVVVGDQVDQDALDEVAEPAALRVGTGQVAAEEAESKLLSQVVGRLGLPEGA